jgi:hypothetical protein
MDWEEYGFGRVGLRKIITQGRTTTHNKSSDNCSKKKIKQLNIDQINRKELAKQSLHSKLWLIFLIAIRLSHIRLKTHSLWKEKNNFYSCKMKVSWHFDSYMVSLRSRVNIRNLKSRSMVSNTKSCVPILSSYWLTL